MDETIFPPADYTNCSFYKKKIKDEKANPCRQVDKFFQSAYRYPNNPQSTQMLQSTGSCKLTHAAPDS